MKVIDIWKQLGKLRLDESASCERIGRFDTYSKENEVKPEVRGLYFDSSNIYMGQVMHLQEEKVYHESEHTLRINGQKELREGRWRFEKPVYPNTLNDYVPHGYGRWLYQGIHGAYILEGKFVHGVAHGYCRWIWDDGNIYQGMVANGSMHGQGKLILGGRYKNQVQDGEWNHGVFNDGKVLHEIHETRVLMRQLGQRIHDKIKLVDQIVKQRQQFEKEKKVNIYLKEFSEMQRRSVINRKSIIVAQEGIKKYLHDKLVVPKGSSRSQERSLRSSTSESKGRDQSGRPNEEVVLEGQGKSEGSKGNCMKENEVTGTGNGRISIENKAEMERTQDQLNQPALQQVRPNSEASSKLPMKAISQLVLPSQASAKPSSQSSTQIAHVVEWPKKEQLKEKIKTIQMEIDSKTEEIEA